MPSRLVRSLSTVMAAGLSVVVLIASPLPAHAATQSVVTHTVPVGASPAGVGITPDGTRAVVANYNSASVSIVDTSLGTVVHTVSVNNRPSGVAISADGTTAYVAVYGDFAATPSTSQIVAITIATGVITKTLTAADGLPIYPTDIIIAPDPGVIYAYSTAPSQWITKITLATDTFTTYSFGGSSIADAALSPDGTRLIVIPMLSTAATRVLDTAAMSMVGQVSLNKFCDEVALTSDGATAYVTHPNDNAISVITVSTLAATTRSSAGSQPEKLTVSSTGTVYVGNDGDGTLEVISGSATSLTPGLSGPIAVVLTAEQDHVLVANFSGGSVSIFRTSDLAAENLTVGSGPLSIATANGYVVVSNYNSNSVSIIRLADLPASGDQVPRAPLQQFGRMESQDCAAAIPDSVLFPGVGEDQRRDGWGMSWAEWPNGGTGGFVCTRQPYFTNSGQWSVG